MNASLPVLLFWPVNAEDRIQQLVSQNVKYARQQMKDPSIFLVHYDGRRSDWLKRDTKWYNDNVDYWAEQPGYKFQLVKRLLGATDFDITRYSWVWTLDEDCDFTMASLPRLFELADMTHSLLVIPAFTQQGTNGETGKEGELSWPVQLPHRECMYRYSPFIEVIFPLFKPVALNLILNRCEHCMHDQSVWGLDNIWCSWTARQLSRPRETACAILDETQVVHKNYKTLKDKYAVSGVMQQDFKRTGLLEMKEVQIHHLEDWVSVPGQSEDDMSLKPDILCVPHPLKNSLHK